MQPELKPCPFCGGTDLEFDSAHCGECKNLHTSASIECKKCDYIMHGDYDNTLIEKWNTRHDCRSREGGQMTNVVQFPQNEDFVVTKEQDDLLKKWVMIGHHYFRETYLCKKTDCTSINILCEGGNISIDTDATSNGSPILSIKQQSEACTDEIQFLACIDQEDAIRLAGMLIAWASTKSIHGEQK